MQIIVLGMHRSGTSMVARLLNMMGAYFAPDDVAMQPTAANPKGYWEREDIRVLNDDIFSSLGVSWDNIGDFDSSLLTDEVCQKFAPRVQKIIFSLDAHRPWMIKDPRLCLLLPVWHPLLEVPVCIYVYRHPIQVAQSLKTREGILSINGGATLHNTLLADYSKNAVNFPIMLGMALWEKYTLNALANFKSLPRILVSIHDLMNNSVETVKTLHHNLLAYEIQGLRLPSDREILAYIEPKFFHEQGDNKFQKAYINTQQTHLVKAFQKGNIFELHPLPSLSTGASEVLVEYQNKLLAANKILAYKQDIVQRDEEITKRDQEITKRDQEIINQQEHITQLKEYIENLTLLLQKQEQESLQYQLEITELNKSLQASQANVVDKEHEISTQAQQIVTLTNQFEQQIVALTSQFEQQSQDVHKLMHWLFALDDDISAVFKSLTWRTGNIFTQIALKLLFKKTDATAQVHIREIMQEVTTYRLSPHTEPQYQLPSPTTVQPSVQKTSNIVSEHQDFMPHVLTLPDVRAYELWYNFNQCQPKELQRQQQEVQTWQNLPFISVVIPSFNSMPQWLETLLFSVHAQTYPQWECIIVDDASTATEHLQVIKKWCQKDTRFQLVQNSQNQGVSSACQTGVENAKGSYLCVVDHDDQLEPQALFEVAKVLQHQQPDVIYSDEMLTHEDGTMIRCTFRPDFNYYFLLSHPYIVHLTVFRRELLLEVGGFKAGLKVSQDYDLLLRIAASSQSFFHIPRVLYRWRTYSSSTGHQQTDNVMATSLVALNEHLRLLGFNAKEARATKGLSFNFFRVRYQVPSAKVSVIIPTKDKVDLLRSCLDSFQQKTHIPEGVEVEFLIVDNNSKEPETFAYFEELKSTGHKILTEPGPFNYSLLNNKAAAQASGSLLLFMNNDIEIIEAGWLEAMLELMAIKDVAVVGAKLLYPPHLGLIQHAGVLIFNDAAGHDHQFFPEFENPHDMAVGHNGALLAIRECIAVTGACMLVRRSAFDVVGGFDTHLHVGFGDTDLCLKLRDKGHKCLITPYARLIHHESATRGYQVDDPHPEDSELFCERWDTLIKKGDPFYNPNLNPRGKMFEPLFTTVR